MMDKETRALQHLLSVYLHRLLLVFPDIQGTIEELTRADLRQFGIPDTMRTAEVNLLQLLSDKVQQLNPQVEQLEQNSHRLSMRMGEHPQLSAGLLTLATAIALSAPLRDMLCLAIANEHLPSNLVPLAVMIDAEADDLAELLQQDNWLARCGFLGLDERSDFGLSFALAHRHARQLLLTTVSEPMELLENILRPEPCATLTVDDFSHLSLQDLISDLNGWHQTPKAGLNVMLWGNPGTGKTESARLLAEHCGYRLYSVHSSEDRYGHSQRIQDTLLSIEILRHTPGVMLLLDEADDLLFPCGFDMRGMGKQRRHQLLETNLIPVIWTMNDFAIVEEASQRRFDWIIHYARPNQATRLRLFQDALNELAIPVEQILMWSRKSWLSHAHIQQAAQLARRLGHSGLQAVSFLTDWFIQRELALQVEVSPQYRLAGHYDLTLLNPIGLDLPMTTLIRNLCTHGEGRILLYGMPGTGKTAFVHYLGEQLGRPVLQKRASDLLSKWVGESEQQVAGAFREAQNNDAILFIDEVDSLLSDRQGHQRNFETSQVNELLSQMESFAGILLMATNLREKLDGAVARRFDYQIELGALTAEQLVIALERLLPPAAAQRACALLRHWQTITLGDIAVLERRQRLSGVMDELTVIRMLNQIAEDKVGYRKPMGFVA